MSRAGEQLVRALRRPPKGRPAGAWKLGQRLYRALERAHQADPAAAAELVEALEVAAKLAHLNGLTWPVPRGLASSPADLVEVKRLALGGR